MVPPPSKSIDTRKAPTARLGVVDTNEDGDAHVFDKWSGTLGGVLKHGSGCEGSMSQLPQVESGELTPVLMQREQCLVSTGPPHGCCEVHQRFVCV